MGTKKNPRERAEDTSFLGKKADKEGLHNPKDSPERAKDTSILGRKAECKALRNITSTVSEERNLRDLHLELITCSPHSSRRRRLIWTFLEFFLRSLPAHGEDLLILQFNKPRLERFRVSRHRAEKFGDLVFMDHGSAKIGDNTFGLLIVSDGATSHLTAYPCKSISTSEVIAEIFGVDGHIPDEPEGDFC